MLAMLLADPELMLLLAPGLLFSLTIHEYGHARMALAFGDPTARDMGRLSLNPLRHLDFMGTVMILLVGFGWAKPVPVNRANLHPPRWGEIAVSLAGVLNNVGFAVLLGLVLRVLIVRGAMDRLPHGDTVAVMMLLTLRINLVLVVFNLLPLFPLDGHHIVRELLPRRHQQDFMHWQVHFGRYILLGLLIAPMLSPKIPSPLRMLFSRVIDPVTYWLIVG
ncbi:hypothetical protein LCGC14_0285140 [marine sediment metagenome]|uniref:Peptidase M50 domain-containing protein n=1 Tax=marine sediment metagenome TaxID=412755 RepID=A0A0F9TV05_9ZZZZ|nr:site-2 protease family protein [Phycisphaerae bacterium]HDZ43632.1 site-2 protease family protein [Phycisphaerae bacterium]